MLVDRVHPVDGLGLLHRLDVQVDHDGFVVAAHQNAFQRFVGAGIDLLVRHVRRHEDEVTGFGLGDVFQPLAPAHPGLAAHHINHAFQRAMVMRAGFRVGVDVDRASPDFLRADPGRLIAAARFMPGVWAVLVSSWSPLMTRTPFSRQSTLPDAGGSWCGGLSTAPVVPSWLCRCSADKLRVTYPPRNSPANGSYSRPPENPDRPRSAGAAGSSS